MLAIPYAINLLILMPVCFSLFRAAPGRALMVFESKAANEPMMRNLILCLWAGIAVCSLFGLVWPEAFVALLVMQVTYKLAFLIVYVLPRMRARAWQEIPYGVSISFLAIVLVWPWFITAAWL